MEITRREMVRGMGKRRKSDCLERGDELDVEYLDLSLRHR